MPPSAVGGFCVEFHHPEQAPFLEKTVIHSIKGVKDILPGEVARWQAVEAIARRLSFLFGYEEIRVPIFEATDLFARGIGTTTDIVEKEMYTFLDRDGKSLTLRPEGTAGVVRAYIEHNLGASPRFQRLFYLGPMFRHERPQAGRLRQFHQYGAECIGFESPLADVEVIALLWRLLSTELHLPGLSLEVNSLGDDGDRPRYKALLLDFLKPHEGWLCQNCRRRMGANPLRVLDCKVPSCREVMEDAPQIGEHLSPSSRQHFESVLSGLADLGVSYQINHRLVRGLDYYALTAFEVTSDALGGQDAVGAGGRYNGLVKTLGGPDLPAVGFAVGLERISLLLPETVIPSPLQTVFVAGFGTSGQPAGMRLLYSLRAAGVRATTDYKASTLKTHLHRADRLGVALVVILGDEEVARGKVVVRNMETKQQEELPLQGAATALVRRLKPV